MQKSHEELRAEYKKFVESKSKNFTIYHYNAEDPSGRHLGFQWEFSHREGEIRLADHYDMVALMQIQCDGLNITEQLSRNFALTNHIETDWMDNTQVARKYRDRARSTSVGDIIEYNETGEKYIVAGCGFRKLTPACLNNITVENTDEVI